MTEPGNIIYGFCWGYLLLSRRAKLFATVILGVDVNHD
jgi:hypothetical protein